MKGEEGQGTNDGKPFRRSLVQGLPQTSPVDRGLEESFVYRDKSATITPKTPIAAPTVPDRTRLTTRIRADLAAALKRATLERKLAGVTPNEVQAILEEALEPWLRDNGYLG